MLAADEPDRPKRRKWKLALTVGGVLFVASLAATYVLVRTSRTQITGKVDRRSGLRVEYSLSPYFVLKGSNSLSGPEFVEMAEYASQRSPGFVGRLRDRILHRSAPPVKMTDADEVIEFSFSKPLEGFAVLDADGYPLPGADLGHIDHLQRLTLAGCQATWSVVAPAAISKAAQNSRYIYIAVRGPYSSVIYGFVGVAGKGRNVSDIEGEMERIRDSIRVVRLGSGR